MSEKYQVLARKYRPQAFADVVGQEAAVTTLKNAIRFEKIAHAYLFCGTRGVGKTTLARLFAKALNCQALKPDLEPCGHCSSCVDTTAGQSLDIIEIDGASNRGIDDIRQINETVGYAPSHGKYKIYIIDEVHMLTKEAFNALLKTLEEPPVTAKFFFATTEPHKVLPTIISRCQRFDLARIQPDLIASKLGSIAQDLSRTVDQDALELIATFADGSLRDAESLFDQILCFADSHISSATVRKSLGLVPQELFFGLDQAFSTYNLGYAFELVEQLFQTGKDLAHFLEQLVEHYRTLTMMRTLGKASEQNSYTASAKLYTQQQCLHILDLLIQAESTFQKSPFPRITLESTLLQIIRTKHRIPIEAIVRKLTEAAPELEIKQEAEQPIAIVQTAAKPIEPTAKPVIIETPASVEMPKQVSVETPPVAVAEVAKPVEVVSEPVIKAPELVKETTVSVKPAEPVLKPAPFNPLAATPKPTPVVETPAAPEPKPAPKKTAETEAKPKAAPAPASGKHPSFYDTLLRFASVELEGTVKQ